MPFCVLGFSPRLVCQLIPKTPNGLQTGSMWGREPGDLPSELLPHQPYLDPRNPSPTCASVTRLSARLPGSSQSSVTLRLEDLHCVLPATVYSGSDLVGATHLAQAHPAGALSVRPL